MHSKRIEHGWIERTVVMRPKARLFTVLSIVWCFVSPVLAALLIQRQVASASAMGLFLWLLILLQPVFIILSLYFRLTERQRSFKQRAPDPNYGLRDFN